MLRHPCSSFDATSALNVNGGDFSYPTGLRFVIRNGSTYYVSEALLQNQWGPNIGSLTGLALGDDFSSITESLLP